MCVRVCWIPEKFEKKKNYKIKKKTEQEKKEIKLEGVYSNFFVCVSNTHEREIETTTRNKKTKKTKKISFFNSFNL